MVELYLKPKGTTPSDDQDYLPDSLLELERLLKELEFSNDRLKQSTDELEEAVRSSQGDEAREYYEYVQDNLAIIKARSQKIDRIHRKMDSLKGIFKNSESSGNSDSCGAGGIMGHYI